MAINSDKLWTDMADGLRRKLGLQPPATTEECERTTPAETLQPCGHAMEFRQEDDDYGDYCAVCNEVTHLKKRIAALEAEVAVLRGNWHVTRSCDNCADVDVDVSIAACGSCGGQALHYRNWSPKV